MMRRARARAITLFDKTRLLGSSGSACFGFLLFLCFIVVGRSAERRPIADRASAADTNYNAERATALTRNDADAHPQDVCALRALKRAFGRRRVRVVVGLARTAAPVTRHRFHISLDCKVNSCNGAIHVSEYGCTNGLCLSVQNNEGHGKHTKRRPPASQPGSDKPHAVVMIGSSRLQGHLLRGAGCQSASTSTWCPNPCQCGPRTSPLPCPRSPS